MGLISEFWRMLFGDGRNVVTETMSAFRENPELAARREATLKQAALGQFAAEFGHPRRGLFDRVIDGLNRLPRPMLAFGTLGLFVVAMTDPIWFAARMQGIALIPEPLWWLMGAIVSFYFGARHQAKGQEFQRSIAETVARAGQVTDNIRALKALDAGAGLAADPPETEDSNTPNAALSDWRSKHDA